MEYTILDLLGLPAGSSVTKAIQTTPKDKHKKTKLDRSIDFVTQLTRASLKIGKSTVTELKKLYNYDRLEIFDITAEQAIKINLGDIPTRTQVFTNEKNLKIITNIARAWQRKNKTSYRGETVYEFEDMVNQIYVDMQYYSYATYQEIMRCIARSCALSNHGGILYSERYMRSVKTRKIISYQQDFADNGATLEKILAANSETTDPVQILENKEERKKSAESEASRERLEALIKKQIILSFPKCKRAALEYAIMGGGDI